MAVSRATSFSASTSPFTGVCRFKSARIWRDPAVTTTQFFAVYNNASPSLGSTTPEGVWAIPPIGGTSSTQAQDQYCFKIIVPNGGYRLDVALAYAVTTTFNGATGSTTNQPLAVDVDYEIGG